MKWVLIAFYFGATYTVPGAYQTKEKCEAAKQRQMQLCLRCEIKYECREKR